MNDKRTYRLAANGMSMLIDNTVSEQSSRLYVTKNDVHICCYFQSVLLKQHDPVHSLLTMIQLYIRKNVRPLLD